MKMSVSAVPTPLRITGKALEPESDAEQAVIHTGSTPESDQQLLAAASEPTMEQNIE